ncbi:hypothetical protein CRUP_025385 [Coryphaenoides rupestris]|nr:hypothetical protein CRUP_025385 [Coryphaenoides rupestris]
MVERSDRAPLLDWEEVPAAEKPEEEDDGKEEDGEEEDGEEKKLETPGAGMRRPGVGWSTGAPKPTTTITTTGTSITSITPAAPDPQQDQDQEDEEELHPSDPATPEELSLNLDWEEKDQIVSVFVVTFNTRSGNMLEWCLPRDMDLDGVEFKAIASGSHRVSTDFIYFRKGHYFGLACFANMAVESAVERGARMKSVGILSPSYTLLYRYMSFLEHQVRLQLQAPGHYSPLEAFYEDKRALLPTGGDGVITHPAGCMSQFTRFFGEQIMVMWKLALLRRRILIFSPPPVGVVCYRVYCCCCLANISIPGVGVTVPEFRPFFYVNVADISALENELAYKIFEEKKDLYDVYVDNQNVKTYREGLKPLLRLSAADKDKYRRLTEQRQMLLYSQEVNGESISSEEDLFILPDPTLTPESVRAMGLDPHGDRLFLLHLLEIYGYDTLLLSDQLCCS